MNDRRQQRAKKRERLLISGAGCKSTNIFLYSPCGSRSGNFVPFLVQCPSFVISAKVMFVAGLRVRSFQAKNRPAYVSVR